MPDIDRKELREKTDRIVDAITSEQYLRQIEKVNQAEEDRKMVAASKHLTPEALREAGVDLPDDARISSRYFESRDGFNVEVGDASEGPNIVNALNERHPGLLDRLRRENPDIFEEIVGGDGFGVPGGGVGPMALCACAGGADSGCAGAGL